MRAEAGYPPDAADRLLPEYDFVVVGGGSAGSAVAARLAEVAEWRVLLLEAGADPPLTADIPPLFHSLQESEIDWGYETEPQEAACLGMEGRRCYWPRGKVLGGSSVLNAMLHVRGNPRDYDAWEAAGNPGWAYRHVRPYFIKAESFEMPQVKPAPILPNKATTEPKARRPENTTGWLQLKFNHSRRSTVGCNCRMAAKLGRYANATMRNLFTLENNYFQFWPPGAEPHPWGGYSASEHGAAGPLRLTQSAWRSPLCGAVLRAARQLGLRVGDASGGRQAGFTLQHVAVAGGVRQSSARAYLCPAASRGNLHVVRRAAASAVLVDPATLAATGVRFLLAGRNHTVRAAKEVVLSAGTVGSAQLLMVSGIGPRRHLESLGIPVVRDLPVGENLQDHMQLVAPTYLFNRSHPQERTASQRMDDVYEYFAHRTGPLASLDLLQVQGFIKTKYEDPQDDYPDVQYQHIRFPHKDFETVERVSRVTRFRPEVHEAVFGRPVSRSEIYVQLAVLQRPRSRGTIRLRSADPLVPPVIDPRYLTHPHDVAVLVEGAKFSARMAKTKALAKDFEVQMSREPVPGCEHLAWETDEHWACVVRTLATTIYHPVGTCKMGPHTDPAAVVDARLRVHGVRGLRVVDASVMPTIVTANINAPVVMIGEKAADMIKQDWGAIAA
ncbi:glucose dehydrogenase [FAD, quinone]-like [Schistocerca serialis cubense]|uniref:glucose dehydrogenase [FAD, quinone]-like n=1 Tax=Schistocerca serialis cubense TaxID=2023355 RepID=UPI00214F5807|nr:glucose dehydrogenase [FAD, quinone]-like [Schistocerca serialis cubense]